MQFLLDHLASVVITGILLLAILATQFRGQQASVDAVQYYDAKIRLLSLVQMIERDFTNIGSGVDSVKFAITELDTVSVPAEFTFLARTDSTDNASHTVTYQWEEEGDVTLKDKTTIPTYTVRRIIDGAISGTSTGSVTNFRIDLFTADSFIVAANYAATRFINVSVKSVSTLGTVAQVEQSGWNKSFRPVNLTRKPQ